jgi:adenine-specific DNA methylase
VSIQGEVDKGEPAPDWRALQGGQRRFLVLQADSARLAVEEGIADYVVTDPPYYDSVQYSDLSGFFRVWLHLFLPEQADWRYDPLSSAVSEGDAPGNRKYGEALAAIWRTCHTALKKDRGRLIFTFHHWRHDAWAELTLSLKRAGFWLANRYVVFSENPVSVHIRRLRALRHDTILVLRPLNGEVPPAIWPVPARIDTVDSDTFCRECGAALGWFLSAGVDDDEIRAGWKRLLEGENGHSPASG